MQKCMECPVLSSNQDILQKSHIMFQNRTFCIVSPKEILKSRTVTTCMYGINVINAEHYDIDDMAKNPKKISHLRR